MSPEGALRVHATRANHAGCSASGRLVPAVTVRRRPPVVQTTTGQPRSACAAGAALLLLSRQWARRKHCNNLLTQFLATVITYSRRDPALGDPGSDICRLPARWRPTRPSVPRTTARRPRGT
eukprot:6809395-Prymnesium_polylepis.1